MEKSKAKKIKKILNKVNKDLKPRLKKYTKDLEIIGENRKGVVPII